MPINELSFKSRKMYTEEAKSLLDELENNRLTVILIPAPSPQHTSHMIRYIENQNPDWYKNLYHSHSGFRRDLSLRALDRIKREEDRHFRIGPYKYDSIYRELIQNRLKNINY